MPPPKNAMEVFKLLDKSNCRECGEKTCLAFAGAVFQGRRPIEDCPRLSPEVARRFSQPSPEAKLAQQEGQQYLRELKGKVASVDLAAAAERLGGQMVEGKLVLKVLGKDFGVDRSGRLYTDIHVNPWVAVPFLVHVLYGAGKTPVGEWVSFRELKEGKQRYALFHKRSEAALKRVADVYGAFFDDIVHMFSGKEVPAHFESDISVVLHPLPKVPFMICYWRPDEGMDSSLNVFFDKTADDNLDIDSVFSLGVGFAQMIGKLSLRHGFSDQELAAS